MSGNYIPELDPINFMNLLIIIIPFILALILTIYLLSSLINRNKDKGKDYDTWDIRQTEIMNNTQGHKLNEATNQVLNYYDKQGIRLPADIIEDLAYYNFRDQQQIYSFIEGQRKNWKYEVTKSTNKDLL